MYAADIGRRSRTTGNGKSLTAVRGDVVTVIDHAQRDAAVTELRAYSKHIDIAGLAAKHGTPLLLVDTAIIRRQYQALQKHVPGVKHYYALKALEVPEVLQVIYDLGGYVDLATDGEIAMAQSVGFSMDHAMHTHPIKKPAEIERAFQAGLRRFVVENAGEVAKFVGYGPKAELMIRLAHHDAEATVDLAYKFGATTDVAKDLAAQALRQGNTVAGFCMHVGSQIHNPAAYVEAIQRTVDLIDAIEAQHAMRITVLDIGGGFPVSYREAVPDIAEIGRLLMPVLRPLQKRFDIVSEPGRFIAGPAALAVTSIVGVAERHGEQWYYIDDGVYGCFSNVVFEHIVPHFFALSDVRRAHPGTPLSVTLAGPSCDSVDVVTSHYPLPAMAEGDLLVSPSMGAYTVASATTFNAIPKPQVVVIDSSC